MDLKSYCEAYTPTDKLPEILKIVEKYAPKIFTSKDEGYEWLKEEEYKSILLVNSAGQELSVDVEREISLFFGDWHAHYEPAIGAYQDFIYDLQDILNNNKCTICAYDNEGWCLSSLSETDKPDIDQLRKDYGTYKRFVCSYWDCSKNVVFEAKL